MNRDKDLQDFKTLLRRLETEGRKFEDGDELTQMLSPEKFPFKTRQIVKEIVFIVEDHPEFVDMIPAKLMDFFSGYKMKREARIAAKVAMEITKGLDGLKYSWQADFPEVTPCCRCGCESRIAFVAHEGLTPGDNNQFPLYAMRDNGGPGDLWPHDRVAVAVYFCRGCLETTALYNQA